MSKNHPKEQNEILTPKKWKRRSQRSFLESLSITKTPSHSAQKVNSTPVVSKFKQDGIHSVTSRKGVICSFTVKDTDVEENQQNRNAKDEQQKKNKCCSMRKNNIEQKPLSKFIIQALNTNKFMHFMVSQIPGFMDASVIDGATLKQLSISKVLAAKNNIWEFGVEKGLQKSTILSSFYLLDRIIMMHKVNSENIAMFAWVLLFISAKLNEEEESFISSSIFKAILDKSVLDKKSLSEVELMVLTALGCKMLPTKEEYSIYEEISSSVFNH